MLRHGANRRHAGECAKAPPGTFVPGSCLLARDGNRGRLVMRRSDISALLGYSLLFLPVLLWIALYQ